MSSDLDSTRAAVFHLPAVSQGRRGAYRTLTRDCHKLTKVRAECVLVVEGRHGGKPDKPHHRGRPQESHNVSDLFPTRSNGGVLNRNLARCALPKSLISHNRVRMGSAPLTRALASARRPAINCGSTQRKCERGQF